MYTHTHFQMGEWGSSNEMPFNIVWNFSLAFFHRSFTCILGGCFWIFHYLMNSYEFRKWKAISHVHAQAKRRHTYKISSKNKVILIIITNRFFYLFFFLLSVRSFFVVVVLYLRFCGILFALFAVVLIFHLLTSFPFVIWFWFFVCVTLLFYLNLNNGPQKNKY